MSRPEDELLAWVGGLSKFVRNVSIRVKVIEMVNMMRQEGKFGFIRLTTRSVELTLDKGLLGLDVSLKLNGKRTEFSEVLFDELKRTVRADFYVCWDV